MVDLGQVFTKNIIANYMVSMFNLSKDSLILDPCFGSGVFFEALNKGGYENFEGFEIDDELYENVLLKWTDKNLYNEDFLLNKNKKKYDGIIMNPPYVRQEKIEELSTFGITKKALSEETVFNQLPSTSNLYMYFILKALSSLRDGGEMIVIFPNSWTNSRLGAQFENQLYANSTLIRQVHLFGELFEKKATVEVFILHLKKGKFKYKSEKNTYKLIDNKLCDKETIDSSTIGNGGFFTEFKSLAKVRRGVTTGYNAMYLNPIFNDSDSSNHIKEIISSPKSIKGYSTKNAKLDSILVPQSNIPLSSEIKQYFKFFEEKIVEEKIPKTLLNKILSGNENWFKINTFESSGILFNYFVRSDMKFIINKNILVKDNFYIITAKINEFIMFALLNNYYTYYQLEKMGKKYGAGLLKIQKYDIENLVFPNIEKFSDSDMKKLKKSAEELYVSGKENEIKKITKIISKYSSINYNEISINLKNIKKSRLEGADK